jgi:hypothetical protein
MNPVLEYVTALLDSPRLGGQVVHHRLLPGREAAFAEPARPWGALIHGLLETRGFSEM